MGARQIAAERRRLEVAKELMKGKTGLQVAERVGITKESVSRIAHQPATKLLLSEMLRGHEAKLKRLVGKSLGAIDDAFAARRMGCSKLGVAVDLGADHFARLAATKRVVEVVQAAREDTPAAGAPGTVTWEAFLRMTSQPAAQIEPALEIEASKDGPDI